MPRARSLARTLVLTAALALLGPGPGLAAVELVPVPASFRWAGAVAEGALTRACAGSAEELAEFFAGEGLPHRGDLVRREAEGACHVFYRPTVPGFRASPDDHPLRQMPNAILTPRIAGSQGTELGRMSDWVCDEVARFASGRPQRNEITREMIDRIA